MVISSVTVGGGNGRERKGTVEDGSLWKMALAIPTLLGDFVAHYFSERLWCCLRGRWSSHRMGPADRCLGRWACDQRSSQAVRSARLGLAAVSAGREEPHLVLAAQTAPHFV